MGRLKANKSLTEIVLNSYSADLVAFNHQPGFVTADPVVRRALMAAIDQNAYNKAATGGAAEAAGGTMSKSNKCYDPETSTLMPASGHAKM